MPLECIENRCLMKSDFDDDFFNHEDTDLSLRAWLSGWKCIFVPEAVVHHKVSATSGILSDLTVYFFTRNVEWVWIKMCLYG